MDLIKRFGTQKKKFKLQFFIGKLKFNSYLEGKVYIVLRRGGHKVKSEQKLQMPSDYKVNFNKEILELQVTLYFDEKENKYQEKPGQMDIVMIDPQGNKILIGIISFDVGQYANMGQESMKEKKEIQQTPKNFQGLLEYNVFIKYIGQGSQSSLDKVADFFFGKSKQPESEKKIGSKNDINSKQKIQDDPKKGSAKDMAKTQAKKGTNIDFYEIDQAKQHKQKNYVTTAKDRQGSRQFVEDNEQLARNFYLNDTENDYNKEKKTKKNKQKSNSVEKKKENRGKGDSENIVADRDSDKKQKGKGKQKEKEKEKGGSIKQTPQPMKYYSQQSTISELKAQLLDMQKKYNQSLYQLSDMNHHTNVIKAHNEKLRIQLASCKEQIRQKDQQLQQEKTFQPKHQGQEEDQFRQKVQLLQKQLKRVQRQKNQLLVENSKLKQKHKSDLKKYQQLLEQNQSSQQSKTDYTKADVLKLKEECSQYRDTIEKLTRQKNDKHQELLKQKTQNKTIQEQLTEVKTSLSKIRLKIGMKLNQVQGNDEVAEILMDLNSNE